MLIILHPSQIPHSMAWNLNVLELNTENTVTGGDQQSQLGMGDKMQAQADEDVGYILLSNFEFRRLGGGGLPQAVVDKVLEKELGYGQYQLQMVQRITGADRQSYFGILTWYAREITVWGRPASNVREKEASKVEARCSLTCRQQNIAFVSPNWTQQAIDLLLMAHVTKMRFSLT